MEIIHTKNITKGDEIYYSIKLLKQFGLWLKYGLYKEDLQKGGVTAPAWTLLLVT
jgi:hypothetical protein